MILKLIPVFELESVHPSLKHPHYPFSDAEYDAYLNQVHRLNGFELPLSPIALGYNLYPIEQTSDLNILKILKDAIQKDRHGLEGGFVLCEIAEDRMIPILTHRCCSDFNDIDSWINLANNKLEGFWIGHPMLCCEIQDDQIRFIEEEEEQLEDILIPLADFQIATKELKNRLINIHQQFLRIATEYQLDLSKVNELIQFTAYGQSKD